MVINFLMFLCIQCPQHTVWCYCLYTLYLQGYFRIRASHCRMAWLLACGAELDSHVLSPTHRLQSDLTAQHLSLFHHHSSYISHFASSHVAVNIIQQHTCPESIFPHVMPMWQCSVESKCSELIPRCIPHVIHLNDVSGVRTWGWLTTWQTWCLRPLPFAISQVLW
jgi:hypothetical protein